MSCSKAKFLSLAEIRVSNLYINAGVNIHWLLIQTVLYNYFLNDSIKFYDNGFEIKCEERAKN